MSKYKYKLRCGKEFEGFVKGESYTRVADTINDDGPVARLLGETVIVRDGNGNLRTVKNFDELFVRDVIIDDPAVYTKILLKHNLTPQTLYKKKAALGYLNPVWPEGYLLADYFRTLGNGGLGIVFRPGEKDIVIPARSVATSFSTINPMENV